MIYGKVRNSVLFPGVFVEEGAQIEDSIIMSNTRIGAGSRIRRCISGENVEIGEKTVIGEGENIVNELKPSIYNSGITVIGEGAVIPAGAQIGQNVMIDVNTIPEDFCGLNIPSGTNVIKGSECE